MITLESQIPFACSAICRTRLKLKQKYNSTYKRFKVLFYSFTAATSISILSFDVSNVFQSCDLLENKVMLASKKLYVIHRSRQYIIRVQCLQVNKTWVFSKSAFPPLFLLYLICSRIGVYTTVHSLLFVNIIKYIKK